MDSEVKYSKTIPIDYKVIKKDDILQFANLVEKLYQENDYKKEFVCEFNDNSTICGDSKNIFETDAFQRRKSLCVKMEYYSSKLDNHIVIDLYSTTRYIVTSKIFVSSIDEEWYNFTLNKIHTILEEIQQQNRIAYMNNDFCLIGLPYIFGCSLSILTVNILKNRFTSLIENKNILDIYFIISMILYTFSFLKILSSIISMFPKVYFAFGPEHKNREEKIKKCWRWIGSVLLIPALFLVISILLTK